MFDHLRARWHAAVASLNRDPDAMPVARYALAALRLRRRRRAAIADLETLSDHLLDDLGIPRAEIPRVVERLIASHPCLVAPPTPLAPAEAPRLRALPRVLPSSPIGRSAPLRGIRP